MSFDCIAPADLTKYASMMAQDAPPGQEQPRSILPKAWCSVPMDREISIVEARQLLGAEFSKYPVFGTATFSNIHIFQIGSLAYQAL